MYGGMGMSRGQYMGDERTIEPLKSVLRRVGEVRRKGRSVRFNESLNLFYDAECSCWVHEDDHCKNDNFGPETSYEFRGAHYEDPPTLSPPEGYKDRFFPQSDETRENPDVTRVSPPSPPSARRKVFTGLNSNGSSSSAGLEDEEESKKKGLRLGGILKGGRLWRSNSSDGKKVISPHQEPDVVKCTESNSSGPKWSEVPGPEPDSSSTVTKVSIGTGPLRTSEQIRLAVDSTLRQRRGTKKSECSSLVEKLRWLTSLDDEEGSDGSSSSGFATWPARDKNNPKYDGSSTGMEEGVFVNSVSAQDEIRVHEAQIKQIGYRLEDIEEGMRGSERELETFVSKDGGRIERIRKRYGDEGGGDDYGFSRRPSVKGIKPKFSTTNQIFSTFTGQNFPQENSVRSPPHELNIKNNTESDYENTRLPTPPGPPQHKMNNSQHELSYEYDLATSPAPSNLDLLRSNFEPPSYITSSYTRPHSWTITTLPHHPHPSYSTPTPYLQQQGNNADYAPQPLYGTVRRVPNLIGRPVFVPVFAGKKVSGGGRGGGRGSGAGTRPQTPSPTGGGVRYPPDNLVRYPTGVPFHRPPPVPPRTVGTSLSSNSGSRMMENSSQSHPRVNVMLSMGDGERGAPEGATDEEPRAPKDAFGMNV